MEVYSIQSVSRYWQNDGDGDDAAAFMAAIISVWDDDEFDEGTLAFCRRRSVLHNSLVSFLDVNGMIGQ